jgi:hypothetical protein
MHESDQSLFVEPGRHGEYKISCIAKNNNRYTLLPAITMGGIIYSHVKVGSYDGAQFIEYLEGLLQVMNPYPAPNSVLIMDNCKIHHVEGVWDLCDQQ